MTSKLQAQVDALAAELASLPAIQEMRAADRRLQRQRDLSAIGRITNRALRNRRIKALEHSQLVELLSGTIVEPNLVCEMLERAPKDLAATWLEFSAPHVQREMQLRDLDRNGGIPKHVIVTTISKAVGRSMGERVITDSQASACALHGLPTRVVYDGSKHVSVYKPHDLLLGEAFRLFVTTECWELIQELDPTLAKLCHVAEAGADADRKIAKDKLEAAALHKVDGRGVSSRDAVVNNTIVPSVQPDQYGNPVPATTGYEGLLSALQSYSKAALAVKESAK